MRRNKVRLTARIADWLGVRDNRLTAAALVLTAAMIVFAGVMIGGGTVKNVDFARIAERVGNSVTTLEPSDENALSKLLGLDASAYEGWLFYNGESVMDVSELLIVKSADEAALNEAEDAVNARLASQITAFESYGTNQSFLLKNALTEKSSLYLFYAVGEHAAEWLDAFRACVR